MLGSPIPILRSFDEAGAKAFYLDFLGFEPVFEHRFEPGMPLYMGVRSGDCVLHLSEHHGDGSPGMVVRVPVEDVADYAASLRAKRYARAMPGEPQLMPWGTREFTVHDPAGNRLTFYSEAGDVAAG